VPRRSFPEVAATLLPVAEELAALHASGRVHGDLSAANVVVRPDGTGALIDFGCSAPIGAARATGTPGFVAPEVEAGAPVTPAAEIWSLAAVARAATTGPCPSLDPVLAAEPAHRPTELVTLFAGVADPRAATTRDYGPEPPPTTIGRPAHRRAPLGAAAVLLVAAGAGVAAGSSRHAGAACPAVTGPLVGDPDGDGCDTAASWSAGVLTVALGPGDAPARVAVGAVGDVVLLGDWDCDGDDTPATYRPATGVVTTWDGWGTAPPRSVARAPAATVRVERDGGCDRVAVGGAG
jgi:hypothetical protein